MTALIFVRYDAEKVERHRFARVPVKGDILSILGRLALRVVSVQLFDIVDESPDKPVAIVDVKRVD